MHKKWLWLLAAACLAILALTGALAEEENLLENPDFELLDEDGLPAGWYTEAYRQDGRTVFSAGDSALSGLHSAVIRSFDVNDARFCQDVPVKPETVYRLAGWIQAEGVSAGARYIWGANFSIAGLADARSAAIVDTDGEWQYVEFYGETGPDQDTVTVFLRLGGYSGEADGVALFDDLSLTEVQEIPEDVFPALWFDMSGDDADPAREDEDDASLGELLPAEPDSGRPFWPIALLLGLAYAVPCALFMCLQRREERGLPAPALRSLQREDQQEDRRSALPLWFPAVLLCALALRIVIAVTVRGYDVDVGCFTAWGAHIADVGPVDFYHDYFCDYPPGYLPVLGLGNMLARLFGGSDTAQVMMVKLPPMLADIGIAWLIAREALRSGKSSRYAGFLGALIALNPVLIINSAAWCQIDSVLALLIVLIAVLAMRGQWRLLMPTFMLAVLVKPQALMLGFLGLTAILIEWIRNRQVRRDMLIGALWALVLAVAMLLPFTLNQPLTWIIDKYAETLGSYAYVTVNTANLYYLFGLNWAPLTGTVTPWPALLLAGFSFLWHRLVLHRDRKLGHRTAWFELVLTDLFTVFFLACALFRFSWAVLGTGAMAFAFAAVLPLWLRSRKMADLPLCGALLFLMMYLLGTKMHERYLFPAVALLGLACALRRDRRQTLLLALLSFTVFINIAIPLDNANRFGRANGHLLTAASAYLGAGADTHLLACVLSVINLGALALAIFVAVDQCCVQEVHPLWAPRHLSTRPDPLRQAPDDRLRWRKADTVILFSVTAVYSVLALVNLGSVKAPQSFWTSTSRDEYVVLDVGENRKDFTMAYYCAVSYADFTVQVSEDGETWSTPYTADMDEGQCFRWLYLGGGNTYDSADKLTGRYVKINANQYGLKLGEVVFRETVWSEKTVANEDGEAYTYSISSSGPQIPAVLAAHAGGNAEDPAWSDGTAVLDEQDTLEGEPGWYNSTYFDEIYHARTAYEHLNGQRAYEWTHPPLGKLLMSLSVAVFGMTPFGWRFAGALTGILMLPVIYLLAKRLTKRTLPAAAAIGMLALDCMHFTQTRIATIDSFPVLFILLSFYFMLCFMQLDLGNPSHRVFGKAVLWLGLSGLSIGCAIAAKWIGLYAGAGLAVLYFWTCGRWLLNASRARRRMGAEADSPLEAPPDTRLRFIARRLPWRLLLLSLCCVAFFVLVPLAIYLLCYIPFFAYTELNGIAAWRDSALPLTERLHGLWDACADFLSRTVQEQVNMYNYHGQPGLGMDHPYYSPWYEWPVIGKPMYYASAAYVPEGMSYSIFCLGNPAVWWTGLLGVAFVAAGWLLNHRYRVGVSLDTWHLEGADRDVSRAFLLIGLLAQFLPWVLVPRGTYIYHYFASVPFVILCTAMLLDAVWQKHHLAGWIVFGCFMALVLAAFILFFPYASGITVPYGWLSLGRKILPNLYYTQFR